MIRRPPRSPLFPSTPLFRSRTRADVLHARRAILRERDRIAALHDRVRVEVGTDETLAAARGGLHQILEIDRVSAGRATRRSEEHTSELQSQSNLVCRLLLEK